MKTKKRLIVVAAMALAFVTAGISETYAMTVDSIASTTYDRSKVLRQLTLLKDHLQDYGHDMITTDNIAPSDMVHQLNETIESLENGETMPLYRCDATEDQVINALMGGMRITGVPNGEDPLYLPDSVSTMITDVLNARVPRR